MNTWIWCCCWLLFMCSCLCQAFHWSAVSSLEDHVCLPAVDSSNQNASCLLKTLTLSVPVSVVPVMAACLDSPVYLGFDFSTQQVKLQRLHRSTSSPVCVMTAAETGFLQHFNIKSDVSCLNWTFNNLMDFGSADTDVTEQHVTMNS